MYHAHGHIFGSWSNVGVVSSDLRERRPLKFKSLVCERVQRITFDLSIVVAQHLFIHSAIHSVLLDLVPASYQQDYGLNLSISLSPGKESNSNSRSSGERTGKSPALNRTRPSCSVRGCISGLVRARILNEKLRQRG